VKRGKQSTKGLTVAEVKYPVRGIGVDSRLPLSRCEAHSGWA
jgi:hypothetical protein